MAASAARTTEAVALGALAGLLLGACAASQPSGPGGGDAGLAGTRWVLVALDGETPSEELAPTLDFASEDEVGGSDGCNSFRGSYAAHGSAIEIGRNLAGTLMACPEPVEARARSYRETLESAVRFSVGAAQLELYDAAGRALARFAPARLSAVERTWEVLAYHDGGQGVVSVIAGTRITVRLGADGRVTGEAGCNRYFASYALAAEVIEIGMPATTRRFCAEPAGAMRQEGLYLEALRSATTLRLSQDRLELRKPDGSLAVSLVERRGD